MGEVAYRSVVRLVRREGVDRLVEMPAGEEIAFGVHGDVARHYGVPEGRFDPCSTTLDYVVAAADG